MVPRQATDTWLLPLPLLIDSLATFLTKEEKATTAYYTHCCFRACLAAAASCTPNWYRPPLLLGVCAWD